MIATDVDPEVIGRHAVRALLDELATFPKPGLVSFADNGSHADMTAAHFVRSAAALGPYFTSMAAAGREGARFDRLRQLAVAAEVAMMRATGGVNTHRGAIFSVGLLAAAAGWRAANGRHGDSLGAAVRELWGADIAAHRRDPASHGSSVARHHGAGGAQAEAASGFQSVYAIALPAYSAALAAGIPAKAASVQAFFALIASVKDTNLLHRGGVDGLRFVQDAASHFLARGGVHRAGWEEDARQAHQAVVARRLSPGGCADLLASCLFVVATGP